MKRPSLRRTHRLVGAALTVLLLASGLAVSVAMAGPADAATGCAAATGRSISGTILGQDKRYLNVQLSFDVVDRYGHHIGPNGCTISGYYHTGYLNQTTSSQGGTSGKSTWSLTNLPANATGVWIETWTRGTTGAKRCPLCTGEIDTSRYGFNNRRNIPVGTTGVRLIAPLNCGVAGGTAGNIQGWIRSSSGKPVMASSIHAWSEATPDGSVVSQGWGQGVQIANGHYKVSNLAAGQRYALWITVNGKTYKRVHLAVANCKAVPVSITAG